MPRLGVGNLDIQEAPAVTGLEFAIDAHGPAIHRAATTLGARDVVELRDQLTEWIDERTAHHG
jgi:hypothetical protein